MKIFNNCYSICMGRTICLVAAEAMSHGIAIISSNVGGLPIGIMEF